VLEGSPSLGEGGSLLLKLGARLLARILLPLELLFCRGEGSGLVSQAGPQQLGLLGFLLSLALPGPHPLEGGAVSLKLSPGGTSSLTNSAAATCTAAAEDQERPSGRWMTAPQ
jgi:hypothetical protein